MRCPAIPAGKIIGIIILPKQLFNVRNVGRFLSWSTHGILKPMTDIEKLAREALELAEKATPGPWKAYDWPGFPEVSDEGCVRIESIDTITAFCFMGQPNRDAHFIAHAGTHYKELAQAVLDLSEENRRLKEKYTAIDKAIEDMEVYGTGTIKVTHITPEDQMFIREMNKRPRHPKGIP